MASFDRTARMVAKMQVTTTMLEEAMKTMAEAMTRYSRAMYGDGGAVVGFVIDLVKDRTND